MKKVSIIIPTYNAEKSIRRCIKSVLQQKYDNMEIIVINDGSTDNTLTILEELQLENSNLYVYSIKNAGVSNARNVGIGYATGEFICFIDSDDYVTEDYVEKMIDSWKPGRAVLCNFNWVRDTGVFVNRIENEYFEKKDIIKMFLSTLLSQPWNKLYETRLIKDNNIQFRKEISIAEDFFFNLEYYKSFERYIVVPEKYNYVINSSGLNVSQRKQKDFINIFSKQCFELMCVGLENNAESRDVYLLDHHYISLMWQNLYDNKELLIENSYYGIVMNDLEKQDVLFYVADKFYMCGYYKIAYFILKLCRVFGKNRKNYIVQIEERRQAII